jgi:DNA-binding CsgD family transcriptional regulator
MAHDLPAAVRLAVALAPWWFQRGRWMVGYELLGAAAGHATEGGPEWCAAQYWLGLLAAGVTHEVGLRHYTAVRDAMAGRPASPLLSMALTCRAGCLANLGHITEAEPEVRRALALARELADPAAEAWALSWLGLLACYTEDFQGGVAWYRQAGPIDRASIPGWVGRFADAKMTGALINIGELGEAEQMCARELAAARKAGALYDVSDDLLIMTQLDLETGRLPEAAARLREAVDIALSCGVNLLLTRGCLDLCGYLCARTGRPAEALTLWAALAACSERSGMPGVPHDVRQRQEPQRRARQALELPAARAAEQRGATMGLTAAAEYVALLVSDARPAPGTGEAPGLSRLSARERELVTLVAQGRTNAQIAGQLFISVRTVGSHLDRIRDKTGCRRRADLTRLALETGLV